MSWPSFYGYKYTPIGLRQREVKDEAGKKTFSTIVHLPDGGHLLDIERRVDPDGSVSKTETCCFAPSLPAAAPAHTAPNTTPRAAADPIFGDERRPISDLERQADDIIANFRARQGTGMEKQQGRASTIGSLTSCMKQTGTETSYFAKDQSQRSFSRYPRRQPKDFMDAAF